MAEGTDQSAHMDDLDEMPWFVVDDPAATILSWAESAQRRHEQDQFDKMTDRLDSEG